MTHEGDEFGVTREAPNLQIFQLYYFIDNRNTFIYEISTIFCAWAIGHCIFFLNAMA